MKLLEAIRSRQTCHSSQFEARLGTRAAGNAG